MTDSTVLRIQLLGPPVVFYGGQTVSIQRKNIRALLFYLACQESMVSRGDLILHFWPDMVDEAARRNLRDALGKLRNELPDPAILVTQHDLVGLDENRVSVDVREFRSLIQNTSHPMMLLRGEPLPPTIYQQLVRAVQMWSAREFMAGMVLSDQYEYQQWQIITGRSLEYMRQTALNQLAEHCSTSGDPAGAINWLRKLLEYDPLNSEYHLRLLAGLKTQGKRAEALNYIRYVQELFEQEGEDLPPAIEAAKADLESESPELTVTSRPIWPAFINMQTPFVGRADILQRLKQVFQRGGSVVLRGEAGSGKTRLAYEFYQQLDKPPRLMAAACRPMESNLPLQPWVDLLRYGVMADEWRALDVVWAARLSSLLPELLSIRPDILPMEYEPDGEGQLALVEAIRQILLIVARKQRILIILDDAQWAGDATVLALEYLQERGFFTETGMLLIAARIEDPNPHLEEWLLRAMPHAIVHVDVPPLRPEEIDRLVNLALEQPPAGLVQRLEKETGGNPFFLLETLRTLLDYSAQSVNTTLLEHLPLSSNVHALVHDRLRRLPPLQSQVLATAAVMGGEFSLETLRAAAMVDEVTFVDVIEALERQRLIAPLASPAHLVRYAFVQNVIREAILYNLSHARKRMIHMRVARALQTHPEPGGRQAARLAAHYEAGGDLAAAFTQWLEAGHYARLLSSRKEAWQAFERAEFVYKMMEDTLPDEAVYRLYVEWGEFAREHDRRDQAEKCFGELVKIGEQRSNPLLVGAGFSGLAQTAIRYNEFDKAASFAENALPFLEEADDPGELIYLHSMRGELMVAVGEFARGMQAYTRAVEITVPPDNLRALVRQTTALYELASLLAVQGHPDRGEELVVRGLRSSMRFPQFSGTGQAYMMLGLTQFFSGKYHQALESEAIALRKLENVRAWLRAGVSHIFSARICLALGWLDESLEHIRRTEDIAVTHNHPTLAMDIGSVRGEMLRLLNDLPGAIHQFRTALQTYGYSPRMLDTEFRLGYALLRSGDPEGWAILKRVEQQARKSDFGGIYIPIAVGRLTYEIENANGEAQLLVAQEHLKQIQEDLARFILPTTRSFLTTTAARVYLRLGRTAEARQALEQVSVDMANITNPWYEMQYALARMDLERSLGLDSQQTRTLFQRALDQIGLHARDPEIRPLFEQFARDMQAKTKN